MATVRLVGVTKRYGDVGAVRDVSLSVPDGELLVLLGPSGSGKSTILKLVAGIEVPDAGEIWIDDTRVDDLLPQFRDVAMVFQSYALYPHMSVHANLAFPLKSAGTPRREIEARVRDVAGLLQMEELLKRRPGQLSGGQQQRVALGRAIIRRPKVFLMDEPLSNLDAKLRARTRLEITRLHERLGVTTVYVTHDQVEAMTMGRRIAVIDAGELHQIDVPEMVYDHPADLLVADFLGSPPMNCVPALVRRRGADLVVSTLGRELVVAIADLDELVRAALPERPTEVVLGIRPEQVVLGSRGCPHLEIDVVVERAELLGNERVVHVVAGASNLAVRVPASVRPCPGQAAVVGLVPAGVRLFDAASGRALSGGAGGAQGRGAPPQPARGGARL